MIFQSLRINFPGSHFYFPSPYMKEHLTQNNAAFKFIQICKDDVYSGSGNRSYKTAKSVTQA